MMVGKNAAECWQKDNELPKIKSQIPVENVMHVNVRSEGIICGFLGIQPGKGATSVESTFTTTTQSVNAGVKVVLPQNAVDAKEILQDSMMSIIVENANTNFIFHVSLITKKAQNRETKA